ncbi:CocE/NonD family hydrolase [Shewanella sp. SG41-4]|uniref:CocE/NonD family hydrolase n=1 Tax=Shewanella sp. SG41-4 TaxID=2760976 RepID=UPI001C7195CE|nr:CocE/NonD family hydrolase [Shewanella sp. SG41-4]
MSLFAKCLKCSFDFNKREVMRHLVLGMRLLFLLISLTVTAAVSAQDDTALLAAKIFDTSYIFQGDVLIKTRDGNTISAIVVRKKLVTSPLPSILQFTIYARNDDRDLINLKETVDHGYVGVIAYTRGKYRSKSAIIPYEYDAQDAYAVIDWISQQAWSDGGVGMMGGSYAGFTQWAAVKTLHPALKTIVPSAAGGPGFGLPMENNIFINPNYEWAFHVTNNKTMDDTVYNEEGRTRFRNMRNTWWETGKAYRTIDQIDGQANPLLQRWLQHPSYDAYWQSMVPFREDFAQINIPVLAFDCYYNDSQGSSLHYLQEHAKYRPNSEDYLIIGPYSHFGSQRGGDTAVYGVENPPNALFDYKHITYAWFDYVLNNADKPKVLKDKINYFVVGENKWRHASSLDKMHNTALTLFLTDTKQEEAYQLAALKPQQQGYLVQTVDFKDRTVSSGDFYPDPLIRKQLNTDDGFIFVSEPLKNDAIMNGAFEGEIVVKINKYDVDYGIRLYELLPNGDYVHLSYVVQRASYARDPSQRQLLTPNTIERLPIKGARLISKQIKKGSRFVVYIDINKNPFSQLNYGTGKDVSDETISDTKQMLKVKWFNSSYVTIPLLTLL